MTKGGCGGATGEFEDDGFAAVTTGADIGIEGDLSEQGNAELFGLFDSAVVAENIVASAAMRAEVVAHILDKTEDANIDFLEHGDAARDNFHGNFLRSGDDDNAVENDEL